MDALRFAERGDGGQRRRRGAFRQGAEQAFRHGFRLGAVECADDGEHGIAGDVEALVEVLQIGARQRAQRIAVAGRMRHRGDRHTER